MNSRFAIAAFAACLAQSATAQDAGLYFGLGITAQHATTSAPGFGSYTPTANDFGLALTGGYRFATTSTLAFGVEGNLDLMSGKLMSDETDACSSRGPTWCELDTMVRLRGTLTTDVGGGNLITASAGAVMVNGRAEDGDGVYVDATGFGPSLGVAWDPSAIDLPLRVDLNYEWITSDDADNYERDLDMVSLRLSYMF
ncbi:MAG: outer membrane beta-barrel protein [Rhodobacterales bacterium]|nr:outer membrane beta-barrel protein [Rhodobacterales bacterium]